MEMEGDEGMMETEEEWGTAPVASSSGPTGNGVEKSEEWGVGLRSPMVSDESGALDDIFDPARFPSSAGTLYEKVAAGSFESILDEKNSANAQQQQQMVEEVVTCLPYLVRVALANPAHSILFQKLHALPQLNSVLAYLALDIDAVEDPLEAELQRKRKTGSMNPAEGSLVFQYGERLVSEFETGSEEVKMRLFLSELHNVMDHVRLANASKSRGATRSFPAYHSEIFGDELYLEELGFILPIAMLRLRRAPLSLEAVIEALLCVDLGGRLLRILFFNMPALRDEILLTLIKSAAAAPHLVTEVLLDLCSLSVTIALFVRTWIMQHHQLPGLALKLTITQIKDEVAFLSGLLHDHKWIDSYFSEQQSVPESPVILLRARLLTMVVEFDGSICGRSTLPAQQRIRLTALIKLYCGLVGLLKLKLEGEEMNAILSLLTKVKDERIAKLGLCWLLACEGLLRHCSKEAVVVCLSSLLKSGHCLEMLSLLAIHFHTNQISSAIELIRETLGLTVAIHSESLNQIAAVFTEDLFTEEVVAKEAVALAVRPKLSDKDTKSFAVMCVYHLLKNKIFSKHRVDVGEWVWSQITQADEPIHYLLPALIEEWVKSILAPTTSFCMKRPLEEQIVAVFSASTTKRKRKEKEASLPAAAAQLGTPVDELTSQERASQVLALYFALYYNEEVLRQSIDDRSRSGQRAVFSPGKAGKGNTVRAYSGELMESLPVKALLSHARERSADTYSNIYPPLLNLVISQFPGLLTVVNMLNEEEQKSSTIKEFLTIPHFNFVDANMRPTDDESSSPLAQDKPVAPEHAVVKSAFESVLTAPIQTLFMLMQLNRLSASALQAYTDLLIFTLLPRLLEDDVQHRVRVRFVELWELLHTLTPFESALKSINAISPPSAMTTAMDFPPASAHKSERRGVSHYSHMDVVMDPLLVFRCDPRLFRIPPLFKMLLQILDTYLTESHKYINTLLSVEPATGNADKGARHEELVSLLYAQDTAVVQLLLEVCIDRDDSPIKGPMEEVRIQSCTFIHQMFCETPQLMKLVHLQGYPDELLPVTVYGIPSIHVALEFLPELLSQPQPERLVFAIKLAGFLIEKYTLPKCIDLARMVLQKIHSTTVASDDPRTFLMETLPSLAKIATTFPAQLAEDTVGLLQGRSAAVGGVAVAHPQLHAQIQATFAALAARAIDPVA